MKHQPQLVEKLEAAFHEVSNPQNEMYGHHLTHQAVVALQQPTAEHVEAVEIHIREAGGVVTSRSIAGDKIVASFLEAAVSSSDVFPHTLLHAVDMVGGLPASERERAMWKSKSPRRASLAKSNSAASSAPADAPKPFWKCLADRVDPTCLREAYGLNSTQGTNTKNGQCVVVNQGYKAADLAAFEKEYKLPAQKIVRDIGKNTGEAGDEASLDTQYIIATGQKVPTTWVYLDGSASNPFANWLTWASNTTTIPFVHSLSVGAPEGEVGETLAGRINAEMMALGARGASIVFASGDSGYTKQQKFGSSSPYVTSVGGVYNGEIGNEPLQVDSISTGGFSTLAANPAQKWQKAAVEHYMNTTGRRPGHLDTTKRCCPDLSIYDTGYYILQDGQDTPIGGTSASAPVFSGMISLINDKLLSAGKPPLGFLNYWLYQNEAAFLDITRGSNGILGFAAVKGYDPASGLGTFDGQTFTKLMAAAMTR